MRKGRQILLGIGLLVVVVLAGALAASGIGFSPFGADPGAYLSVDQVGSPSDPGETVAYDNLTSGQRQLFDQARETESHVRIPDDADSDVWYTYDSVRDQNETYRVSVAED